MKFTLYHTNDIHSHFDAYAGLASYLKKHKQSEDLLLDAGDFHDFRSIMISGTSGAAGSVLLEDCAYDAISIGNNEGFSGIQALSIMAKGKAKLLSCNLLTLAKEDIPGVLSHIIVKKAGLRFLIIGISPYDGPDGDYNKFFHMDGLHIEDPLPIMQSIITSEQGNYDFCVALSHLGYNDDIQLAHQVPKLDLIIGGHSHTYMKEAIRVNQSILFTAHEYGKYLGKLELEIANKKIIAFKGSVIPNTFEPDPEILKLMQTQEKIAEDNLKQCLYTLKEPLSFDLSKENELINLLCDALALNYPCDFALINHGIVESGLDGEVSKMKLLALSPSPLNPTLVKLSGKQIKAALQHSFNKEHTLDPGRGAGFRGSHLGAIGVSAALSVTQEPFSVTFNQKPLEDEQDYLVMTSDYLQRGSGYPMLKTEEIQFYSGFIRGVLEKNLDNEDLRELAKKKRFSY